MVATKCFTYNALEEWHLVTPHQDDQTIEYFKYSQEECLTSLLSDNAFVSQKEWMANVMHKPYTMKVKDFGSRIKTLNCFQALMPHDKQDSTFTETDLKALLLKSMPLAWQNAYMLRGTCATDNFCQMLSYFVQTQSIGDNQTRSTPSFVPINTCSTRGRISQGCLECGQFGKPSSLSYGDYQNSHIPRKVDTSHCGVYLDYRGPCPVHPTLTHTWGDCFNNPKNNNTSGRNINNRNRGGRRSGHGSYNYN